MLESFKHHNEMLAKHSEEVVQLRKEMLEGFKRHDEEMAQLRKEMIEGFKRHDELLTKHGEEIAQLRKEMLEGFRWHDEEILRLREDVNRGFALLERHLSALGARWGLMAEDAFREGLRGLLAEELGLKVEKWRTYDESGRVFGYPS